MQKVFVHAHPGGGFHAPPGGVISHLPEGSQGQRCRSVLFSRGCPWTRGSGSDEPSESPPEATKVASRNEIHPKSSKKLIFKKNVDHPLP